MAAGAWDPQQYERFARERREPFFDLLRLVRPRPAMRVVDLGCGTGELTAWLHRDLHARETVGIDSSAAMLERSAAFAGPGIRFERQDIRDFQEPGAFDLIFSNAALHWVPDHAALLRRLTESLAPAGQLAVQVPAMADDPSQVTAVEVAGEEPFLQALQGFRARSHTLTPDAYAVLLDQLGFAHQHVRLQVYLHHLRSREEVVEWVKGSLLTDYRSRLTPELYTRFLQRYRERLQPRLPDVRPFLFPFKRILFWAAEPGRPA